MITRNRFLIIFCVSVAAASAWQVYGDPAREMIASSYPQLSWLAPQAGPVPQNADAIALASRTASSPDQQQSNAIPFDLDAVRQHIDRIATNIASSQEQTTSSADRIATSQEQIARSIDQLTAYQEHMTRSIDQLTAYQAQMTRSIDQLTAYQAQMTRSIDQFTANQEQMTREITKLQEIEQAIHSKNSEPSPRPISASAPKPVSRPASASKPVLRASPEPRVP